MSRDGTHSRKQGAELGMSPGSGERIGPLGDVPRGSIVLEPAANVVRPRSDEPLSSKAKWGIVSALTAAHPVLLYVFYPIVGDAINTIVLAGPVAATLLLGIRVGVLFMCLNTFTSGVVFWVLADMSLSQGMPKALVSLLVTSAVCAGADRLRHFIAQRRAMEAALRQAQKLEAIGRLAAGVAHDINNTLNAIMGSTFALRHELTALGRSFQDLDNIAVACDRGAQLTRNLLGFARKSCQRDETFSLNTAVREVQLLLSRTMNKNIRLEVRLAEQAPLMLGDEAQIEHAVMNLCLNAIDAMGDHGTLTLTTNDAEDKVSVQVSDSGSGMDEEVREHAFEPFFTTKPIGKGTGMGLAMVYGTVQAMRGEIALFTKLGEGTTITLTFPKASADTPGVRMAPVAAMDPRVFEAACVLLVDDEPLVLRSGGRMLHAMGCEVLSANSGREGVELFKARREAVSLAIIDLVMPDMDGVATMRELHALVPELPVLLTSGYAPDAGRIDVLIDGPRVAYLAKPYDPSALISAAAKLLPLPTRHKGKTGTE